VALKIIKLGMDTKQVISLFQADRQAFAMMEHPNISRVLEAGATETVRPYFVMELVRGVRITEYSNSHSINDDFFDPSPRGICSIARTRIRRV
jgi:hypothetical protein